MLYKLSGCDTGNFMKISPSGGAVAITYLGEEPVYVGIGMAFHDFHHITDTEIRDVFDERLSDITAESFAYIRAVGAQLYAKRIHAQIRTTPLLLV